MIFGRPTNLILGAFTALFNVVVLALGSSGHPIDASIVAAVNIAAAAVIGLVAYQPPHAQCRRHDQRRDPGTRAEPDADDRPRSGSAGPKPTREVGVTHMADTLTAGTPRRLLVQGRDPFADEAITVGSNLVVAAPDANGQVFVSVADGVADGASDIVSVAPGAEDAGFSAGEDDITISVPVPLTPLTVTLE